MKRIIIFAAIVVIAAGSMGLSMFNESASCSENAVATEIKTESSNENDFNKLYKTEVTNSREYVVSKIGGGISSLIDLLQSEKAREAYITLEKEASVFVSKVFEKVKERLPEDLAIELAEFDVNEIKEVELQKIKNECKVNSKYNAEKISAGFNVCGKAKVVANGKTNLVDIAFVVLKEDGEWKVYSIDYNFPEGVGVKDVLADVFIK